MKRVLILLYLFLISNLFANGEIQEQANYTNPSNETISREFFELYDAIEKMDLIKIQFLVNHIKLNQNQKDVLINKIRELRSSNKRAYCLKLLFGSVFTLIGIVTLRAPNNFALFTDPTNRNRPPRPIGKTLITSGELVSKLPTQMAAVLSICYGSKLLIKSFSLIFKHSNLRKIENLI